MMVPTVATRVRYFRSPRRACDPWPYRLGNRVQFVGFATRKPLTLLGEGTPVNQPPHGFEGSSPSSPTMLFVLQNFNFRHRRFQVYVDRFWSWGNGSGNTGRQMSSFSPKQGAPIGERFSQVYMDRGAAVGDSPRMRHRLAAQIYEHRGLWLESQLARAAEVRLGVRGPHTGGGNKWQDHLRTWPLNDVLDLVTVAHDVLEAQQSGMFSRDEWVKQVNKIFAEENIQYRVDAQGGVHPYPDEEFARSRSATIAALQSNRYANVLAEFEAGSTSIGKDNKMAIRRTFGGAESLFRLMFSRSPRLTAGEADQLADRLRQFYDGDATATGASAKLLASFKDWIDACHFYRHEPGQEEVAQPPTSLAVHLVSTGASFIRLLAEIDAANPPA
jgi:hypothetical protein